MTRFLTILTLFSIVSCGQNLEKSSETTIVPFELILYNANHSLAYTYKYLLTEKSLKIIFSGELKGEKDSTLFRTDLQPNDTLNKLSHINIDKLQEYYSNPCIEDGSQVTVKLKKENKTKTIHLSNYYQPDIGLAIELINSTIPTKYKINYNKDKLLKDLENCK